MKLIALYKGQRSGGRRFAGFVALDEADHERLSRYHWRVNGRGYVIGRIGERTVALHREVIGLETGDSRHTDHLNHDKLDNRRSNLRVVTPAQNAQNVRAVPGTTSKYRGVHRFRNKWRAKIGKQHIGLYATEEEAHAAAEAYCAARLPYSLEARKAA